MRFGTLYTHNCTDYNEQFILYMVYETLRATLKSFNEILNDVNDKLNTFLCSVIKMYLISILVHRFVFV